MKITTQKISLNFTNLPRLVEFMNRDNDKLSNIIIERLKIMDGSPVNSNADFKQIAIEFEKYCMVKGSVQKVIRFNFYKSKNYFIGHKVISHADRFVFINYNTRFHSIKTNSFEDWLRNFFHELTHLVDQSSIYSFGHIDQKDFKAAPFVIGDLAVELYKKHYL